MEVRFAHFTQSGRMLMPVACDFCLLIGRAITVQTIQRDTLKNTINKLRQNPKKCSSNLKEVKNRGREEGEETNR